MTLPQESNVHYINALDNLTFHPVKPSITSVGGDDHTQLKQVCLQAGIELKCHQSPNKVIVTCLRGKATFTANGNDYVLQPGCVIVMPPNTPHGATAETDVVFLVCKISV